MRNIKIILGSLLLIVGVTSIDAQDKNNPFSVGFGVNAVDLLMSGGAGRMVQLKGRKITSIPLDEVVGSGAVGETSKGGGKTVDPEGQHVQVAKAIGISFGEVE